MTIYADLNPAVSVPFSRMRQLLEDTALQAGVVGATDLKVAQRGAGANMSVDVPAGQAWVEVTTGTRNGLAHVVNDATANVAVTASNATNPRIDQLVLQYNDSSIPTGSGDVPTLAVLAGTATAGATLDNRTGAAALGADRLRLADILVPAASTTVTTANIRDRRPWARGARWSFTRTAGDLVPPVAFADIDATNLKPRIECSGAELMVSCVVMHATPAGSRTLQVRMTVDGVSVVERRTTIAASSYGTVTFNDPYTPAIGSHIFAFQYQTGFADGTIYSSVGTPLTVSLTERVSQNASNT